MAFLLLGCSEAHKWTWQPVVHGTNTDQEAQIKNGPQRPTRHVSNIEEGNQIKMY